MQNKLRNAALLAAMMMTMITQAKSRDVGGKVIDEKGNPLPQVNVVLLSLPDSSFVQGAVTDESGLFRIVTDRSEGLLKLTSISYETLYLPLSMNNYQDIRMKEDTQMLGEVVVKSQMPKTMVKGDAMRTTVSGTILEKAGTVSDALSKIPSLEAERDGAVKVLGRGDAEVYINGRRVQDIKELSRLRSDQILHVDVVQNPGARYAASTKAVVRITLKKAQGEGISFQEYVQGMYQYGYTLTNNLDVNYRKGGFDITASFWCGRYGHSKSLQENDVTYYVGPDFILSHTAQESRSIWKGWSPQLQVNYMANENHSFGAFYKYDDHPGSDFTSVFHTDNYENGRLTEQSESNIWEDENFRKHIFNAYYNGRVGRLGIDLNVDGLFDDTEVPGGTQEVTTDDLTQAKTHRSIDSKTNSGDNFWATKLIFTYPLWKGNLSVGGEYSYNHRTDAYDFKATDAVPVKTTDTEINERSTAGFVEYGRPFGKVFAQVGLRYEHLKNDYYNFGVREDEVCRNYGDWFPTVVVSAPVGKVQVSLTYRQDIQRPNYRNLSSFAIYINRYTYQMGNPYLKPTYTHNLALNTAYKWANLTLNYSRIKDTETMSTEPFPGADDPLISLVRPINTKEDFDQLAVILAASPTIGRWHPRWSAYTIFQNYKSPCADGTIITLNRPWVNLNWQNDIELPRNYRVSASMQLATKGDYNNFRINAAQMSTQFGLQHDFSLRRLGTLTADFRCIDIFNTSRTKATIFGLRELTVFNPARRTFMLDLTWKFNEARSKYRGKGAGEKQKARM